MKAALLTSPKTIEVMEVFTPQIINNNDVLIRMKAVGVCGSDVHYFSTGRIGSLVVKYPFILGHEGAGVVEKIGSKVTTVEPGDEIAVEPAVSCGTCSQCLAGRPHTCLNNKFLGCPGQLEGNLSEYLVMSESQCVKLPSNLTMVEGALSEPLSIGLYANKQADYSSGLKIGILGFGPIGMSVLLTSQAKTPGTYYITDKIQPRLDLAIESGAKLAFNPNEVDVVSEVSNAEPEMLDVVFECCGQQDALDIAFDLVKPGGKVVIVGIPEFDNWIFSAEKARRKEITIIHVRRQNHCVEETLELMSQGKLDASKMITHNYKLPETQEAFDLVDQYKDGVMKAMVEM